MEPYSVEPATFNHFWGMMIFHPNTVLYLLSEENER